MVDWDLAISVFITGILGVMVIMFLLQLTVQLTSVIIRFFEKRNENVKAES